MIQLVFSLLVIILLLNLLLLLCWFFRFKEYKPETGIKPFVSVLVAARNEEENIGECLQALLKQDFPSTQYEILVGDDDSSDKTVEVVNTFKNVKLISVVSNLGKARGKANVLAHLAREARGNVFLITDADIRPEKSWISGLVSYLDKSTGIINGTTGVKDHLFQHYEWLFAQGMVKVITDLTRPVTAVGNNMLITREAYEATGGYENIEFSITEDYALFETVKAKGFNLKQVVAPEVLAWTLPASGIIQLLQQRKRWMRGAVKLPLWIVLILGLQGLFFPVLILGLLLNFYWALIIFVVKVMLQALFINAIMRKLRLRMKGGIIFFEIYTGIISTFSMIFYLLPVKIKWKERQYK